MARQLATALIFPADTADAYAELTDPAYIHEVAERTGGFDIEVQIAPTDGGGHTIVSKRSLPAQLPSYAKAFVGEHLIVTETRAFGPAGQDGSREGTVTVDFGSAPVGIQGTLHLAPTPTGSACEVRATVKASIPFVGGKIEGFAADEVERFMNKESQIAAERLGG